MYQDAFREKLENLNHKTVTRRAQLWGTGGPFKITNIHEETTSFSDGGNPTEHQEDFSESGESEAERSALIDDDRVNNKFDDRCRSSSTDQTRKNTNTGPSMQEEVTIEDIGEDEMANDSHHKSTHEDSGQSENNRKTLMPLKYSLTPFPKLKINLVSIPSV